IAAVVVVGEVERPLIRAKGQAVWLLYVVRDFDHVSTLLQAVDGLHRQFARLAAAIARIGEIHPSPQIHTEVIGRIEALALEAVGNDFALAGPQIPPAKTAASPVGTVTGEEVSFQVKGQAV